jgi:predicted TIM-barrel fold metal-dependent hydrolase/quinol monooxygenase YgiN
MILGFAAVFGAGASKTAGIVDVHSHIVTDEYLDCLRRHNALMEDGYPLPSWSEASHIAFMDSAGIDKSVLTLSSPQPWFGDVQESAWVIRSVNEAMARAKNDHPDRFLWCAALPQPDVEASVTEALYALDSLGADGIKLATSAGGIYLGDPKLDPLMQVLNDRKSVIILHPVKPGELPDSVFTSTPAFVYEYPVETTRAVLNMIANNVMTRYPDIKVVVPHAASFLPYAIPRLKGGYPLLLKQGLTGPIDIDGNLAKLYYDLAGAPSPQAVKMMLTITTHDHILFGSDYPFVPAPVLQKIVGKVKNGIASEPELCRYVDAFFSGNALRLFGEKSSGTKEITYQPVMKEAMQSDGIVRLSKIEVFPEWLEEYMKFATEVGAISLQTEPGVLTMYAVADKDNPCNITILETYSSQEAYRKHIASPHFQKYKQGTLHMVKSLVLDDVTPLNPDNQITNFILDK